MRDRVRSWASSLFPHDSTQTTCPPAPLRSNSGPTVVVASLMRSGTHLLLDALFNNYPIFRRFPLFVDFDAYARQGLPIDPLRSIQGVLIKTHYPETPLPATYVTALSEIATRSIVLTPIRDIEEIRTSLSKWDVEFTPLQLAEIKSRFELFWYPFSPTAIEFTQLLDANGVKLILSKLDKLTGLTSLRINEPVMPAQSRMGVYVDKLLTRIVGRRAPRINTTIGYRLSEKRRI